jgi:transposase InsO family protein
MLPIEQKITFVVKAQEGRESFSWLCKHFGISRRVGYKWVRRYGESGMEGLKDQSRQPKHVVGKTPELWIGRIKETRLKYRHWGPKKIYARLGMDHQGKVPGVSTIGRILWKEGLVTPRSRRKKWPRKSELTEAQKSNNVWAVDFKGWFRTGDGKRCDPLTISDLYTRYILCCQIVESMSYEMVKPVFLRMFKQYGLPQIIRVDNGSPFASRGAAGLSQLSVWWMRLGIKPEFIAPAHPQQNGAHERMHRTLKAETLKPAAFDLKAQQQRFDQWRWQFNTQRPHESLNQRVPSSFYQPSSQTYPSQLLNPTYAEDVLIRRVRSNGQIKWKGRLCFMGAAFVKQSLGLKEIEKGRHEVYFFNQRLGQLNDENLSEGLVPQKD